MTDGERLVWATSFSIALERTGDSVVAAQTAAAAIEKLREAAVRRSPDGGFAVALVGSDAMTFLDEIVSAP
jgi:hypothetical protein